MTKSRTKQSVDTLQQMVASTLNKAQVEKDEGLEAEILLKILIVAEGQTNLKAYAKYVLFLFIIFFILILAQIVLKAYVYFYLFIQIHYMYEFPF